MPGDSSGLFRPFDLDSTAGASAGAIGDSDSGNEEDGAWRPVSKPVPAKGHGVRRGKTSRGSGADVQDSPSAIMPWDRPQLPLYGNENALGTLASMLERGRLARAFLLFGDGGLGKKRFAGRFAEMIVAHGMPEHLKHKRVDSRFHPDIIWVEGSGKTNTYAVDTVRWVSSNAYVAPNDSDFKVYIFPGCDLIQPGAQNALLKVVEEPPSGSFFIFTATHRNIFLPTLQSRCICMPILPVDRETCIKAVEEQISGVLEARAEESSGSEEAVPMPNHGEIERAAGLFHGNIGMSLEYLARGVPFKTERVAKGALAALGARDEYSLLRHLSTLEGDRALCVEALRMMDQGVRDAMAYVLGLSGHMGCCRSESDQLGSTFSIKRLEHMHSSLQWAAEALGGNGNMGLGLAALCGKLLKD